MKDTRKEGRALRGAGAQERAGIRPEVVEDVVRADTEENPQRREMCPRQKRMERRSTGAPTGADRAARQRDAGSNVSTANSAAQKKKPDMMLKYRWNGVLYWCAGGVQRAVVRSRGAILGALARILSMWS